MGRRALGETRREFFASAARLTVGAAFTTGAASLRASAASEPQTIHLETRETKWEIAPGRTIAAMTYDGRVPGPEIRVREGERIRVVLKNSLSEPTTIHWHGVDVPNAMDG